jgi:hypothetical protein
MKKLLLSLSVVASAYWSSAQVIVAGVSPASIVANYPFTWAEPGAWGTPDFNIPGTFVQDTLKLQLFIVILVNLVRKHSMHKKQVLLVLSSLTVIQM